MRVAVVGAVSACHNVLFCQYFSWPFCTLELDGNENTGWESLSSKEQNQIGHIEKAQGQGHPLPHHPEENTAESLDMHRS